MAEGRDKSKEYSFFYDGSEEIRTVYCDPCKSENKTEEAEGFCINCEEHLCNPCLRSHQKFRAFRTHNLLYGDSIPEKRNKSRAYTVIAYCDFHPTNEVQYYCKSHKVVYCRICQTTKHSTCKHKEISEICDIERDRSRLHQTIAKIEDIQRAFENTKEADETKMNQLLTRTKTYKARVKDLQTQMNAIFSELQEEISRDEKKTEGAIRESIAVSTDVVNHIASFRRNITAIEESDEPAIVFTALVKSMNLSSDYKDVKGNTEQKHASSESCYISTGIKQVMEMCEGIVKLFEKLKSKEEAKEIPTSQPLTGVNGNNAENRLTTPESKKSTPTKQQDKNRETLALSTPEISKKPLGNLKVLSTSLKTIKTDVHSMIRDITGCLFLSNGSLILCDHANSNIILLDNDLNEMDELHLKGNVWDAASLGLNNIVVSLLSTKRLEFVSILNGKLHRKGGMDLKRVCWGLASDGENIYMTYHNNPGNGMVEIRKKGGQIVKQVTLSEQGIELMTPYYISLDESNGCMYISDSKQNSIICITMEGKFVREIKIDKMKWPRKVIVGENHTLIICSSFSNLLVLVREQTGHVCKSTTLFQTQRPQAACIRWKDTTLVITTSQNNTIRVLNCKD